MSRWRRIVAASVLVAGATCVAAWAQDPADAGEILPAVFVFAYWVVVEAIARSRDRWALHGAAESRRLLEVGVVFVAAMIALGQTLDVTWHAGMLPPAAAVGFSRFRGALLGGAMAYFGDRLAKLPSPWRLRDEPFDWQRVHGFTGRLWTGIGSLMVLVWTTTPLPTARRLAFWLVIVALVAAPVRKLTSVALYAAGRRPALP